MSVLLGAVACGPRRGRYDFLATRVAPADLQARWVSLPYDEIVIERAAINLFDGPNPVAFRLTRGGACHAHGDFRDRRHKGVFVGEVSLLDYARLCELIDELHLKEFDGQKPRYELGPTHMDETHIEVHAGGRTVLSVTDYCETGPARLWAFETAIDRVIEWIDWRPDPNQADAVLPK